MGHGKFDQCQYDATAKHGFYLGAYVYDKRDIKRGRGKVIGWGDNDVSNYDYGGSWNNLQVLFKDGKLEWKRPNDLLVDETQTATKVLYDPTSGFAAREREGTGDVAFGFGPETTGRHFGGTVCAVIGLETQCVQYRTGDGVLLGNDATRGSFSEARCSAWHGGYFEHTILKGDDAKPWKFLALKNAQRVANPRKAPMCTAASGTRIKSEPGLLSKEKSSGNL